MERDADRLGMLDMISSASACARDLPRRSPVLLLRSIGSPEGRGVDQPQYGDEQGTMSVIGNPRESFQATAGQIAPPT